MVTLDKAAVLALHASLYRVRVATEERGILPKEAFARYESSMAHPQHVHRSKSDHVEAVKELAHALDPGADP